MKGKTISIAIAAVFAIGIVSAQKTKPATKPAPQKPAAQKEPGRIVLGTNQLAGDQGKFNLTYTIGQRNFTNVTLLDAKFSVERFVMGNQVIAPDRNQKVLILTYTVQNPNNEITGYGGRTLSFTAIDQEDVNHEAGSTVTQKSVGEPLNIQLKPAQKITCQTAILVPAKGTVPKLMVQHESGGAVLRYDLREVLKPLDAPFAGEGFDALPVVKPTAVDQYVPMMLFDLKYESNAFVEKKLGPTTISDDKVFFLPKITVHNATKARQYLKMEGEAITEDGDRYPLTALYKASSEEHFSGYLDADQENTIRPVIVVPKKAKLTGIRLWETTGGVSRSYQYPVDAQFTKAETTQTSTSSNEPAITGLQADEYTSIFKDSKGNQAMQIAYLQTTTGDKKSTEVFVGSQKALLVHDSSGVTLSIPATGEVLHAPKAQGKEPETSLNYYSLAYANAAAPKPKKKNVLGQIAGNILGNAASGLGQQLVSGAVLSGFGQASMPAVINAGVQSQVQGYAVHSLASQLGRAVLTSAQPVDGNGPEQVEANVTVDKSVYVQTNYKGKKAVSDQEFAVDAAKARQVNATDLYKRFADFMAQGLPK